MKKKILVRLFFLSTLVIMAVSFDSCQNTCKMCAVNEYDNGSLVNAGTESQYCGTDLIKEEAIPDVTVGNITTKVECR
jgi:hypothetical protein